MAAEQGLLDGSGHARARTKPTAEPAEPRRFADGQRVRVGNPVTPGHTRVPRYTPHHVGTVVRHSCTWSHPTTSAATGRHGPIEHVYAVSFDAAERVRPRRRRTRCVVDVWETRSGGGNMSRLDSRGAHRGARAAPARPRVTIDVDAAIDDTVISVESGDGPSPALGAKIVARAWTDPEFKARLVADATATRVGVHAPDHADRRAREHARRPPRDRLHPVLVLSERPCSATPPAWYKSFEYRSRVVREPRAVLAEFGMDARRRMSSCGWSTRPRSSASWCCRCGPTAPTAGRRTQLAALVTRDSMIGTGRPLTP